MPRKYRERGSLAILHFGELTGGVFARWSGGAPAWTLHLMPIGDSEITATPIAWKHGRKLRAGPLPLPASGKVAEQRPTPEAVDGAASSSGI